jgi:hypothetical protein
MWKDNIKMDLMKKGCEDVYWLRIRFVALVNTVTSLKARNFLTN